MAQTIYLIRHGETDYNKRRLVQGSGIDSELNATGRAQAAAFHKKYGTLPFEAVFTSALQRTHQTVAPFVQGGLPWQQFPEINELSWGTHEGKVSTPEMVAEYQAVKTRWGKGQYEAKVSGGESAHELAMRLHRFLDFLSKQPQKLVLVCSHGRAMCGLVALMKGLPLARMNDFSHTNTGLWVAQRADFAFEFSLENDTSHLPPVEQLNA